MATDVSVHTSITTENINSCHCYRSVNKPQSLITLIGEPLGEHK